MKRTLYLPLKREYFEAIRSGEKTEEYRLYNSYWRKRLEGKEFDHILLTLGYPSVDDHDRRLFRPWKGYTIKDIIHPHFSFGNSPVKVFAIDVSPDREYFYTEGINPIVIKGEVEIHDQKPTVTMVKCTHCNGTGKVRKVKTRRKMCSECGDHNHGCFGTGKKYGHEWCLVYTAC